MEGKKIIIGAVQILIITIIFLGYLIVSKVNAQDYEISTKLNGLSNSIVKEPSKSVVMYVGIKRFETFDRMLASN